MKIFLVGFMGAGKSLLGQHLAAGLGCDFFDLDTLIESSAGCSIPDIFAQQGEAAFRQMEAEQLRATQGLHKAVIATGGGTPCFFQNMDWMNDAGVTLYLQASEAVLFQRLRSARSARSNRPLLAGKSDGELKNYIAKLLGQRQPFYAAAQFTCRADLPIPELTAGILGYFRRFA